MNQPDIFTLLRTGHFHFALTDLIRALDKIIVLNEGKIEEEGNHKQLLTQNGIYADIYEKQQIEERLSE